MISPLWFHCADHARHKQEHKARKQQIEAVTKPAKPEIAEEERQLHLQKSVHDILTDAHAQLTARKHPLDTFVECVVVVAIAANSICMGVSLEFPEHKTMWRVFSYIFTVVFALEMAYKLIKLRRKYFNTAWNLFDFLIAWVAIVDDFIMPLLTTAAPDSTKNVKVLRVLQSFRILRSARLLRLLSFKKELLILIEGLAVSVRSMFWVSVMLFVFIYAAAIFIMDLIRKDDFPLNEADNEGYFSSLPRSMLTLFNMVILDEWADIIWPIGSWSPALVPLFIIYITVCSFGILNLIIGVITERSSMTAQKIESEEQHLHSLHRMKDFMDVAEELFAGSEGCTSKEMTYKEFLALGDSAAIKRLTNDIDLPFDFSMGDLHMILDRHCTGTITKANFIEGMQRLIFCNKFQTDCIMHLEISNVKHEISTVKQQLAELKDIMLARNGNAAPHLIPPLSVPSTLKDSPSPWEPKWNDAKLHQALGAFQERFDSAQEGPVAPCPSRSSRWRKAASDRQLIV